MSLNNHVITVHNLSVITESCILLYRTQNVYAQFLLVPTNYKSVTLALELKLVVFKTD